MLDLLDDDVTFDSDGVDTGDESYNDVEDDSDEMGVKTFPDDGDDVD